MFDTKELLLEAIYKCIPYSNQITQLSLSEEEAIRFTWRSLRFRVSLNGSVEEVGESVLIGSDASILLSGLIRLFHSQLF